MCLLCAKRDERGRGCHHRKVFDEWVEGGMDLDTVWIPIREGERAEPISLAGRWEVADSPQVVPATPLLERESVTPALPRDSRSPWLLDHDPPPMGRRSNSRTCSHVPA